MTYVLVDYDHLRRIQEAMGSKKKSDENEDEKSDDWLFLLFNIIYYVQYMYIVYTD